MATGIFLFNLLERTFLFTVHSRPVEPAQSGTVSNCGPSDCECRDPRPQGLFKPENLSGVQCYLPESDLFRCNRTSDRIDPVTKYPRTFHGSRKTHFKANSKLHVGFLSEKGTLQKN